MAKSRQNRWRFNRQVNLAVVVQLALLASLIVGSWVNLQRQLYILQHDVSRILECQKDFQQKVKALATESVGHEYRLQTLEKDMPKLRAERDVY